MLFVVLTQPSWPPIYPPAPPVVGHALIVNKDFIEMVALLLLASTPGRWGGLDYFLYRIFGRPVEAYLAAAVLYFIICFTLSWFVKRLHKKIAIIR